MSDVYGDINLIGGVIKNLASEAFEADPAVDTEEEGRIIYNTTESAYKYNNGSAWLTFEVSSTSSNALIETLGSNWINENFSFNPTPFNDLSNFSGLTTSDSLYSVIQQIDNGLTDAKNVVTLQSVPLAFSEGDLEVRNIIYYDGAEFVRGTINELDTLTIPLFELEDTNIESINDNQSLVNQGGLWVNLATNFQYQELSGTVNTFVVPHNLGTQFCSVDIIDMSLATPVAIDSSLITSITFDSVSQLTVTLTVNTAVTILVNGLAQV